MSEEKKTLAGASESNISILPINNADVKHLVELKEAAKKYVTEGYPIVPMGLNRSAQNYKLPLIRWKEDGPLTTVEEVERCFADLGKRVFGIATIVRGYILADFDTKETPKLFSDIELTPTIRTGKGYHMWFAADSELKQNGPVDLSEYEKRDGKKYRLEIYTKERLDILAPSKHHSGENYECLVPPEDAELAKLPESIRRLCKLNSKVASLLPIGPVTEGGRHPALREVVTYFAREHNGNRGKIAHSTHDWNRENCVPPLEKPEVDDLIKWVAENYKPFQGQKSSSKSDRIQELIEQDENVSFFHDQNNQGYARIKLKERFINVPIFSDDFKDYVRRKYYLSRKETISTQVLDSNLGIFNAKAKYECDKYPLFHRVASVDGVVYYDLCNDAGEIIKIDDNGWSFVDSSKVPYLFKVGSSQPQVRPEQGGDLKSFLELVNIKNPESQMLLLSTLPVRLLRDIHQAIVYIHGPAGSAKSTLTKMVKDLLDPSSGGISMPISKVEDAIPLLNQTWVFANDNITKIDDNMSNFLCVVATGAESSRRTLFKNSDLTVFELKNPVYLNGINIDAYRSDLMSRILTFKTDAMTFEKKINEEEMREKYLELKPYLLGALFDTLSKAMKIKKEMNRKTAFRMTDFSLWGAACAEVLGYGADAFERAIRKETIYGSYDAIHSVSAGRAVLELIETEGGFDGTATALLKKLRHNDFDSEWSERVADNPSSLSKKLRDMENSFAAIGIVMDFGQRNSKERKIVITKTDAFDDGMTG